jgi:predicted ArsR family transcriptional regulator
MDLPTGPSGPLAQPTRAQLFKLLGELRRPAGTEELADRLKLHRNGVRVHLERLREAGLVMRDSSREARGRPRDMWSIAPDASPGGDPPTGYASLGRWLTQVLAGGKTSQRAVETAGREIGRDLAPEPSAAAAEEQLHGVFVALGFQPRRKLGPEGELTYCLCNCPYRDAASESQAVVCTLHRGITRGLLEAMAPNTKLTGFAPADPYAAGCLVEMQGDIAQQAAARTAPADAGD